MPEENKKPVAPHSPESFWCARIIFVRLLGCVYGIAFLSLAHQAIPLFGDDGILPAAGFLRAATKTLGGAPAAALQYPTLFFLGISDSTLQYGAWLGVALSGVVILGLGNGLIFLLLWLLYSSYVNIGQIFYGYGWESLLLETGFLAVFFVPFLSTDLWNEKSPPPALLIWLLRWLLFRVVFGAGMIKLRSHEPCWRELTCLVYHYETQPIPNPVSWYLHQLPLPFQKTGVLFNHFVELIVPWFFFVGGRITRFAGFFSIVFQLVLIVSGNLSFLNWLTIAISFACFDDKGLRGFFSPKSRERIVARQNATLSRTKVVVLWALGLVIGLLSINPLLNMLSPEQVMNTSFDSLRLVNTYGAFGTVGKQRFEVILEGTSDAVVTQKTEWKPIEFHCKPGAPERRLCFTAPYQYRIDWQIWFAAMSDFKSQFWLQRLVYKLLSGSASVASLFVDYPFPHGPPKFIRGELYRYEFTTRADHSSAWWKRRRIGSYFPPLGIENFKSDDGSSSSL